VLTQCEQKVNELVLRFQNYKAHEN
jgi:hypothetical protein